MAELEADANAFLASQTTDMFAQPGKPARSHGTPPAEDDARAAEQQDAGAGQGGITCVHSIMSVAQHSGQLGHVGMAGSDSLSAQYSFRGGGGASQELEDWAEDDEQQQEKPLGRSEPVVMPARRPFHVCATCLDSLPPGDLRVIGELGRTPLLNAEALVDLLIPGAELTTEGLLGQMSDEELVLFAYSLDQVNDVANKRLVTELKQRDEWRSICTHRKEYLQLLDGSLTTAQASLYKCGAHLLECHLRALPAWLLAQDLSTLSTDAFAKPQAGNWPQFKERLEMSCWAPRRYSQLDGRNTDLARESLGQLVVIAHRAWGLQEKSTPTWPGDGIYFKMKLVNRKARSKGLQGPEPRWESRL
eukprot:6464217-Amphidinium_carterae.1